MKGLNRIHLTDFKFLIQVKGAMIQEGLPPFFAEILIEQTGKVSERKLNRYNRDKCNFKREMGELDVARGNGFSSKCVNL
jgi:hypothetical protein